MIRHDAVAGYSSTRNLAEAIRARIAPQSGVDLEFPSREPARASVIQLRMVL